MICFVTDRRRAPDPSCAYLLRRITAAAAAGVELIQIRERDLADRDLMTLVVCARGLLRGTSTRLLVNDRVDIAIASRAAGVHLRQDSPDATRVRAIAEPGFLIGRSIHDPGEAADARDCDFLLFGTVFPSPGKPAGHPVAGVDALRATCARSRVPVLAIGGIDETNARAVAATGAAGIAAVGIFMADRPLPVLRSVVRAIRSAFDS